MDADYNKNEHTGTGTMGEAPYSRRRVQTRRLGHRFGRHLNSLLNLVP